MLPVNMSIPAAELSYRYAGRVYTGNAMKTDIRSSLPAALARF